MVGPPLGDQEQNLDRGLPFLELLFGLGRLLDLFAGVLESDKLATARGSAI
jgi:hypothetical protein